MTSSSRSSTTICDESQARSYGASYPAIPCSQPPSYTKPIFDWSISGSWRNGAHFFGVAASLMRRILVDHARARLAEKRGGGLERLTLHGDEAATAESPPGIDVLALHESLSRMAAFNPRQERIVELRYFGGLTIEEAAEVIGISEATLVREWTIAKAWLRKDAEDERTRSADRPRTVSCTLAKLRQQYGKEERG